MSNRTVRSPGQKLDKRQLIERFTQIDASKAEAILVTLIEKLAPIPEPILSLYGTPTELAKNSRHMLIATLTASLKSEKGHGLYWGLALLGDNFKDREASDPAPVDQIDAAKRVFMGFINRLIAPFLDEATYQRASIIWLVRLVDTWHRTRTKETGAGFKSMATIRITVTEPNPYKEDRTAHLHLMNILSGWRDKDLKHIPWKTLTPQDSYGAFIFLMTVFAGVTNRKRRQQILRSIRVRTLDTPYASLLLPRDAKERLSTPYDEATDDRGIATYRWIPDPITAKVKRRCEKRWLTLPNRKDLTNDCLQKFLNVLKKPLKEVHLAKKITLSGERISELLTSLDYFRNMTRLANASRDLQRYDLPSDLWHYLEGDFETRDLYRSSLLRLQVIDFGKRIGKEAPPEPSQEEGIAEVNETPEALFEWVNHIVKACQQYQPTQHERFMARIKALTTKLALNNESFLHQCQDWIIWLLEESKPSQDTRIGWIKTLLPMLLTHFDTKETLNDLDAEERQEEFDAMLTEMGGTERQHETLYNAWVSFHRFLIIEKLIEHQAAPFIEEPIYRRVDAEYFSEYEFMQALRLLHQHEKLSVREKSIAQLVMTLSYRLGLRRSEATKIAVSHLDLVHQELDVISVKPWSHRRLKTPSSIRTLPLKGLLKPEEVARLRLWVHLHKNNLPLTKPLLSLSQDEMKDLMNQYGSSKVPTKERFLFLSDNALQNPTQREKEVNAIVANIHRAMREASGCKTIRFHHLRHACATNTMLLLNCPYLPNSISLISDLMYGRDTTLYPNTKPNELRVVDLKQRAQAIREALLCSNIASDSELYVVSRLLGHSSPVTTTNTYIHALDLLVGAYLHERLFTFPKTLINAINPTAKTAQHKQMKAAKGSATNKTAYTHKPDGYPVGRKRTQ